MAGVELQGVVEEDEDEIMQGPKGQRRAPPKGHDWDRTFGYKTFKIVRIRDRYLGMVYWGIVLLVICYIVFIALIGEGKHQTSEPGVGSVITRVRGKAFDDNDAAFDEADLRYPEIEPHGAFVMTKSVTIKNQIAGACIDYDKACEDGSTGSAPCECDEGSGYCKMKNAWCPSLGIGNADQLSDDGEKIFIQKVTKGLENLSLEFFAGVSFPGLTAKDHKFYVAGRTDLDPNGRHELRKLTLGDLLTRAEVKLDSIRDTGAVIVVSFYWNCDVSRDCLPTIVVQRADHGGGYTQKRSFYYVDKDGNNARDAVYMTGIRIVVESSGIGKKSTVVLFVIQVGSMLALLRVANMVADFLMLNCYPERKVRMYYRCKVHETQDYSDLQDRINIIKDTEKETSLLLRKNKNLGMGAGGRGGMAGAILS